MNLRIIMVALAFFAGILASNMLTGAEFTNPIYSDGFEYPLGQSQQPAVEMPSDRIEEKQIIVQRDKVVLDIKNAQWSTFTPTKSMLPIIDTGANAIQVAPDPECEDVSVGDIISYESEYAEGVIIHRVIGEGIDVDGEYFIAKGDNNPGPDPGKIRCRQIKRVLVAIIY